MQNFPASVVLYIARMVVLPPSHPSLSLLLFFVRRAQSESARAPTGGGRIGAGILEILAEYIFRRSHPFRNASEGWFRIYMSHGTLSGSQPRLSSAFKNNEDHFLCPVIFFLSYLPGFVELSFIAWFIAWRCSVNIFSAGLNPEIWRLRNRDCLRYGARM